MLLVFLSCVQSTNFLFNETTVIDFDCQEAPYLIQTIDLFLLLDSLILEPEAFSFRFGDSLGELGALRLLIRLCLHALLPNLTFDCWDNDSWRSISLSFIVEFSLGANLRQGSLQLIALFDVGQRGVRVHQLSRLDTLDF